MQGKYSPRENARPETAATHCEAARRLRSATLMERNTASRFWEGIRVRASHRDWVKRFAIRFGTLKSDLTSSAAEIASGELRSGSSHKDIFCRQYLTKALIFLNAMGAPSFKMKRPVVSRSRICGISSAFGTRQGCISVCCRRRSNSACCHRVTK